MGIILRESKYGDLDDSFKETQQLDEGAPRIPRVPRAYRVRQDQTPVRDVIGFWARVLAALGFLLFALVAVWVAHWAGWDVDL